MRRVHWLIAACTAAGFCAAVQAQAPAGHLGHGDAPANASAAATATEGEVRNIDRKGRKITLKHGPIRNLDMPAMTMVFQLADSAELGKIKVGDKVRFVAANPGGQLTVTQFQPLK